VGGFIIFLKAQVGDHEAAVVGFKETVGEANGGKRLQIY
jgi:hypothetical protein